MDKLNGLRGYSTYIPREVDRRQAEYHLAQGNNKVSANIEASNNAYLQSVRNGRDPYDNYPSDQGCQLI